RRGKGVCLNDVRTRFEKAPVNVADGRGLRQRVKITVVLEVFLRVRKPFAANFLLAQSVSADGRAHGAVNDDNAFIQGFAKQFAVVRHGDKIAKTTRDSN